jgi:hypothetical protein
MPQCRFPIFCCFCVSEKLHRKYSRNWMKQKPKVPIFPNTRRNPKQRQRGTMGEAHYRVVRASPWPRHKVVWLPGPPSDTALPPIYSPRRENLKPDQFLWNILQAAVVIDARSGGPEALPDTLPERGITAGGLLHHHACLWSDESSLPWTTGP